MPEELNSMGRLRGTSTCRPSICGFEPGPACYGLGGEELITDAAVVLGYIDPEHFLGGRMKLDKESG